MTLALGDSVTPVSAAEWDAFVMARADPHLLQTSPWGDLKARFGWQVDRFALRVGDEILGGAQVLYRPLPGGIGRLAYVPRGPVVAWSDSASAAAVVRGVARAAARRGAVALMIEPPLPDAPEHSALMRELGFQPAPVTIQPPRTILIDISSSEDAILSAMKSKTRYNIRLAGRKGVLVHEAGGGDLPTFCRLMEQTGERDAFGTHTCAYYGAAYELFGPRGWARLLLAEVDGEPVAGIMAFALPPNAWYLYGASGDAHREKMPNYLLQWRAIQWAKSMGCTRYDLWGVPDADLDALEDQFTQRSDGLWGVYRFKRGFGGDLVRTVGAWDLALAPLRYRLYRAGLGARKRLRAAEV